STPVLDREAQARLDHVPVHGQHAKADRVAGGRQRRQGEGEAAGGGGGGRDAWSRSLNKSSTRGGASTRVARWAGTDFTRTAWASATAGQSASAARTAAASRSFTQRGPGGLPWGDSPP